MGDVVLHEWMPIFHAAAFMRLTVDVGVPRQCGGSAIRTVLPNQEMAVRGHTTSCNGGAETALGWHCPRHLPQGQCPLLAVSTRHSLSVPVTRCQCPSLSVSALHSLSVPVTRCQSCSTLITHYSHCVYLMLISCRTWRSLSNFTRFLNPCLHWVKPIVNKINLRLSRYAVCPFCLCV